MCLNRWLAFGAIVLGTTGVDAWAKSWALANLEPGMTRGFVPGLLNLTLTTNTGGAFGIGRQHGYLMTAVAVSICLFILVWLVRRVRAGNPPGALELSGLGFILGGAFGNLIDRFVRGSVVDFLDFAFMSFPVFNVADAMIDVGAGLVIIAAWRGSERGDRQKSGADAGAANSHER